MNFERFKKIALARYNEHADSAAHFTLDEVIADAEAEFRTLQSDEDYYHDLAVTLVQAIDGKRASRAEGDQLDLLTGEPAALDQIWRLGDGRRVRARFANRVDAIARIGVINQNESRVVAAASRERRQIAELLVYMLDDDVLIPDAVTAWLDDQEPDGSEPAGGIAA